jgi:hypothetical protein
MTSTEEGITSNLRVFISYPVLDGLSEARSARQILEGAGHTVWMWEHDKTLGALTWREIAECIVNETDIMFYICTASSIRSYGQGLEASYALNSRKKTMVVRLDAARVPVELTARTYGNCRRAEFDRECKSIADDLPKTVERIQKLEEVRRVELEAAHTSERCEYIETLNSRTDQLDASRVRECKEEIWRSYEAETLPRRVASLRQEPDARAAGFHRIGLWERIGLTDFNNPRSLWRPYFSDFGRAMVAGERNYLRDAISQQVKDAGMTISTSSPEFRTLTQAIEALIQRNTAPDTILAPIGLFVPFVKFYRSQTDWSSRPEKVLIGGTNLSVFWSHIHSPLDRFLIFSSRAGVWRVVPDHATGRAISIALGQSSLYPDEVECGVEAAVRYDVTDPKGFCVIRLVA